MRIHGHEPKLMLQRESRDPKIGIRQDPAGSFGLAAQPRVREGSSSVRMQDFESAQKLLRPHQGLRGNTCQQLTIEELPTTGTGRTGG